MAGLWLQRLGKYGAQQLLHVPASPTHQGWETQTLKLAQPFTKLPVEIAVSVLLAFLELQ